MTVTERVNLGAAFLDRKYPDWEKKINLETLNIGNCSNCILGQLFGNYMTSKHIVTDAYQFGFTAWQGLKGIPDYNPLTDAWKTLILNRRYSVPDTLPVEEKELVCA